MIYTAIHLEVNLEDLLKSENQIQCAKGYLNSLPNAVEFYSYLNNVVLDHLDTTAGCEMVNKRKRVVRHQNDPCSILNGSAVGDSTESGDENSISVQGVCSCEHVLKAVDLSKVKKALKVTGGLLQHCKECKTHPKESVFGPQPMGNGELWLCLKCGNQACGREEGEHAIKHHKTPHSECHALVVGTENWNVWCYSCNQSISPSCKKKLSECIDFVKRQHVATIPITVNNHSLIIDPVESDTSHESLSSSTLKAGRKGKGMNAIVNSLPRVRGLANLGNTCFFNALLQCLARTPFLLPLLRKASAQGKTFRLPGGSTPLTENLGDLPELECELGNSKCGNLLETLADTLEEVQSSKVDCFSPNKLLQKVTRSCPQFAGGEQHDSHELLRHLLEAVRTEDLKAIKYACAIYDRCKNSFQSYNSESLEDYKVNTIMRNIFYLLPCIVVSLFPWLTYQENFKTLRYQAAILHELGLSEKSVPEQVEEELRLKAKAYGRQANEMTMCPEQIFQGCLVSTLVCQECLFTSHREEKFLDLSLPVIADKPQPPSVRRKGNHDERLEMNGIAVGGQPSKYQLKKEKKQARKGRKQKQRITVPNGQSEELNDSNNKNTENGSGESEQSDADVEDNVDAENKIQEKQDVGESGYSSEKQYNEDSVADSPVCNNINGDSAISSPCSPINSTLSNSVQEQENCEADSISPSPVSSEINTEIDNHNSAVTENTSIDFAIPNADSPVSHSEFPNNEAEKLFNNDKLAEDISRLSISNHNTNTCMALVPFNPINTISVLNHVNNKSSPIAMGWHDNHETNSSPERNNTFFDSFIQPAKKGNAYSDWNSTLASRYQCEEGDFSLESCLNQFTAIELLTGSNKVGCERCTKLHSHNNKEEKTVYTNSTKQLLISSVPPVLILHLKRFQVQKSMFSKMSRHVSFPLILDIAPICSVKCKDTSFLNAEQNKILYSLYGIVEHSGSLHRGHYVAYVKVRVPVEPNDPRWSFLPSDCRDKINNEQIPITDTVPEPPEGKWYFVSDSRVNEVGEDRVLKSQAYLLFYERIW